MASSDFRAVASHSIKPRKPRSNANRSIFAVVDEMACDETGSPLATDDLIVRLRGEAPSIIVTSGESVAFLNRVTARYGDNPNYNFRVAPIQREIFTGKQRPGRKICLSLTSVAYFGWQREKCGRANGVRNRYHLLIDPLTFSNGWLDSRTLGAHVEWMQQIRDFCMAQGWNLRPTQGSIARQALQDHRFYPKARRKVPRATNERVRKQLPGNHYQLGEGVQRDREYEGEYLDQSKCHHYHAINARLPDSNHLYGYGHFRSPTKAGVRWKDHPARIQGFLEGFMGMLYGEVYWPVSKRRQRFVPRALGEWEPGKPVYFYSEDLPLFESLGIRVTSLIAAWGSKRQDSGLRKYAEWALAELGDSPPRWKKALLLAPYGALATTARKHTVGFHRSKGGIRKVMRSKAGTELEAFVHETKREGEPSTNNVLHRALIEASNRTETLLFARHLEDLGYHVLCIYVDAVMVEADEDLSYPLLPPWRLDRRLTRLRFLSDSQFTSNELVKLPGITGAEHRRHVSMGIVGKGAAPRVRQLTDREFYAKL